MGPSHGKCVREDANDDERLERQRKQHPALEPALTRSRVRLTERRHQQAVVPAVLNDQTGGEDRGCGSQEVKRQTERA